MQTIDKSHGIGQKLLAFTVNASQSQWVRIGVLALVPTLFLLAFGNRMLKPNLAINPGFERGTNGWYSHDGFGAVDVTTASRHSGRQALVCRGRSAHFCGPQQLVLDRLQPGKTYICSGWVRLENGEEEPVKLTIRQKDDKGRRYHPISSTSATSNSWRYFSGRFDFQAAGTVQELVLYFEGPKQGVDLLLDDVKIVPDRFLLLVRPFVIALAVMAAGSVLGLMARRPRWSAGCGIAAAVLGVSLLASWLGDHRKSVVIGSAPDFVKIFQAMGFEKVVRGPLLEIKENIQEPTLYEGTGVRIYGNCATNLAILAKNAQIYGRVQGKVYFRGEKLTIQPSADIWGGIEASGQVVRNGTIRSLPPIAQTKSADSQLQTSAPITSSQAIAVQTASASLTNTAEVSTNFGRLTYFETIHADELAQVFGLATSANGKNLYAAALEAGAVVVYRRELDSGRLFPIQMLREPELNGAINIRISPDQNYAVVIAHRARAVILFKRDLQTGKLEELHRITKSETVHGLSFLGRVKFSPNARQAYVLDGAGGGITTLACDPTTGFQWLETLRNEYTTRGSRGLEVLPDGRTIVVANNSTHTLTIFARDPATGRLSLRQTVHDGQDGADQLKGQVGVAASPDGKFVYVSSGYFGGDDSISVFRVTKEGTLESVQSFINGQDDLLFVGGRDTIVSPDGRNLYAVAAKSGTLASFARDAVTGKLRLLEFFVNDPQNNDLQRPACPECSPDGRFVYVPLHRGISIFKREISAGN